MISFLQGKVYMQKQWLLSVEKGFIKEETLLVETDIKGLSKRGKMSLTFNFVFE